ncbi:MULTISPECIES: heavy metal translocating P-type ATPase [unclassified Variovorax]|jgi:Zn2+/Cd2+-exporting ATPase|uniref:heavy metal translocating P-type ATPase n=1 Tax=unclassified Variovorax TaxID=663243 RepID=UPI00086E24F1|nr:MULTISPECIES: heavy metal translocating P-type ATPase [unclassified Variovorax]MBN8756298.1 heavy metal translocating P-type ATPase [Variovorax sp.]ODU14511.1 MAG: ATPase [Variovorax sp. SCN 67-85]ODV26464.1 MAG: ATPase [Variovorax sp. SCN 67-20]OJZ02424.1 MAG: ATPase [Variovorax sp. 67-131]
MTDSSKLRLDLPLILPDVDDVEDHCVQRLTEALEGRPGISEAHIVRDANGQPQLCLHYDQSVVSITRLRELVGSVGAQLSERFSHLTIRADGSLHARAARSVAADLRSVPGVLEADVSGSGSVRIEYDRQLVSAETLRAKAAALGIHTTAANAPRTDAAPETPPRPSRSDDEPIDHANHDHAGHKHSGPDHSDHADHAGHDHGKKGAGGHAGHDHSEGGLLGEKSELIFAALAGVLLTAGWLIERSAAGPAWLPTATYIAAYFFGGFYTVKEAFENLKARRFEIDTLMLVAALGAAALGKWAEGALLLFLFSLGHSLEHYAMGRARKAIEALAKLAPETATVRRDSGTEEVAVEQLKVGDVVVVRPNERLPADGVVVVGTSSVNQAPVTGESVPVDKRPVDDIKAALAAFDRVAPEHRVFAGTINGSGAIEVTVARRAEQSTMARVVKMVTEAEAQRSPTQQFTERFERIFVPAVLALVVLLLFAGFVIDEPFSDTFYRAMAVLVAASPCALAISVPSAVLSGVARAGRGGVLVKGGGPLENLGTLTSIAFDKTGTLTEGKPKLTDAVAMQGVTDDELLAVALAVEEHSDHPLATAIVSGARERLGDHAKTVTASDVKSITGRGVRAQVDGELVYIGKPILFSELPGSSLPQDVKETNDKLVASGRTTMVVRKGERYLGVIAVMDTPRPVAAQVMAELRALGIERLIMISGDNQQVADAVAKSVGLTEARGDLMPEQKVDAIKALRKEHGKVAMVGDGVNDAPAMANSTVGIAMGAAGSDVALETADVALMADDLTQLPFAVGLSRSTSRIIKQNLYVSLGVVAVLIPATIFGLNIGTAVLFHEGSTLLVVVNALRLLAYKKGTFQAPQIATAVPAGATS